ncbi:MAG: T9SS type A sorting domain-containing protein [Ignavibacteriaceae bacterium]|nr:T9SS type A sorting domain-containing protein [Ignavibacteriaceae bacterium]
MPGSLETLEILQGIFANPPNYNFPQYSEPPVSYKDIIVNVENDPDFHKSFYLSQNYPNPFNPSTKISWQSPVGSWQTIKIYDVLGNEVATLVNEYKPAGSYEVEFNASPLPSGVYFYQLLVSAGRSPDVKTENYIETKKMVLLK